MAQDKEYERGWDGAKESIGKGSKAQELLNQARRALSNDAFDRGWKDALKQHIATQVKPGRYSIKEDSEHTCCFEYSVIDTESDCNTICECFSIKEAKLICDALNKTDTKYRNMQ